MLAQHLACGGGGGEGAAAAAAAPGAALERAHTSAGAGPSSSAAAKPSYASATGRPTSYARVHGEVSRAPAAWRRVESVAREALQEVIYEKAEGEGIAKVGGARGCSVVGWGCGWGLGGIT